MDGTVLVADDDRTIRTVLTQALTRAGCKVHATSSMVTLMRWVEEGKGDLVISDVIMPDGTHLEGGGVQPDMRVLPTPADLASGRDPVLAKALTMAGYPTDAARAGTLLLPLNEPGDE